MAENPSPVPPQLQEEQPNSKRLKISSTTASDEERNQETAPTLPRKPKYKRRKIAIFFAYCGVGYQGMQKNPGAKTIEGDLEEALYLSGAVPEQDRGQPRRYDWARSARTDKGVSAAGQVVSGRFYVDPPGFVERLNSNLSPLIRIFGYKRVTQSFNSKKFCDRRRYVYLIPVFALDPLCHRDREIIEASLGSENELVQCLECSESGRKILGVMGKRKFDSENVVETVEVRSGISSNSESAVAVEKIEKLNPSDNNETANVDSEKISKFESVGIKPAQIEKDIGGTKDAFVGSEIALNNATASVEKEFELSSSEKGKVNVNNNAGGEPGRKVENGAEGNEKMREDNLECQNSNGPEMLETKSKFCYGEAERERFNRILKYYEGTHNFHNFTTRTKAEDPSAKRYIVSFNANTVVNIDGIDFVKCEVVGQSFMLHQIRKMIGLAVAIMRDCASELVMETAFEQKVNIKVPMAPEVGLYLDECFFSSYNKKWEGSHEELSMKAYAEEAEDFKKKHIYPHIASAERKDGVVALWLHSLNHRNYQDLRGAEGAPSSEGK